MNITKKTEGLTAKDLYSLTKGNDVRKMADAEGEILNIKKFVLYEDANNEGVVSDVLAVETAEGARYATNSKTFIRNFSDIVSMYENAGEQLPTSFKVGSGTSRAGRKYLTCDIA